MEKYKLSNISGATLWFGASISIAEIYTGSIIGSLDFKTAILAILLGHLIGCILLYFTGLIGAKNRWGAMEAVSFSFGKKGSIFFSVLNVLQLVGWTGVMIASGSQSFNYITKYSFHYENNFLWCIIISFFIIIWLIAGFKNIGKLNLIAVISLFCLAIFLCFKISIKHLSINDMDNSLSFGNAMELSIMMPLSWLPLISDYTKEAKHPTSFTLISSIAYFVGSCFMYIVGVISVGFLSKFPISNIFGVGAIGLIPIIVVLLSTVTTTYLDVYSGGESFFNINKKINKKLVAIIICVIGTLIAILVPTDQYENFLYIIGAVFAPMTGILLTDYFILKKNRNTKNTSWINFVIWLVGFIGYQYFSSINTVFGSTFPIMVIVSVLCIVANFLGGKKNVL